MTESGEKVGESKTAAKEGIGMVVFSRILMASPGRNEHSIMTSYDQHDH